mgnify:CR=1 FL=1
MYGFDDPAIKGTIQEGNDHRCCYQQGSKDRIEGINKRTEQGTL